MAIRRLYWDIETSPNIMFSWRAGYKINLDHDNIIRERGIICICYKWEGRDEIGALTWENGDDTEILETFSVIMGAADEMVAHNGDRFDMRWFNGRNLLLGLPPIPETKTVDTLAIAKRKFFLNSYKLEYLAQKLCGAGKIKTDFSLWKRIVLDNDPQAMADMVKYCKRDVELLEQVHHKLAPYYKPKSHVGVMSGDERWTCPQCGSERVKKSKTRITPMGMKQHQMHCNSCGRYYTISNLVFRKYLEARYAEAA